MQLPSMGDKPQRLCEPCYKLRQGDRGASAAETLTSSRQTEASLKESLLEKHQQAENFRDFLVRISAKPPGPEPTADASLSDLLAICGGGERVSELSARPVRPDEHPSRSDGEHGQGSVEIDALIALVRRRWRDTCEDVATSTAAIARLRGECDAAEQECEERTMSTKQLCLRVKDLQASLKDGLLYEAQRDQLLAKTREQQEELEGLTQRMLALEASRGPPSLSTQDVGASNSFEVHDEQSMRSGWPIASQDPETRRCVMM